MSLPQPCALCCSPGLFPGGKLDVWYACLGTRLKQGCMHAQVHAREMEVRDAQLKLSVLRKSLADVERRAGPGDAVALQELRSTATRMEDRVADRTVALTSARIRVTSAVDAVGSVSLHWVSWGPVHGAATALSGLWYRGVAVSINSVRQNLGLLKGHLGTLLASGFDWSMLSR